MRSVVEPQNPQNHRVATICQELHLIPCDPQIFEPSHSVIFAGKTENPRSSRYNRDMMNVCSLCRKNSEGVFLSLVSSPSETVCCWNIWKTWIPLDLKKGLVFMSNECLIPSTISGSLAQSWSLPTTPRKINMEPENDGLEFGRWFSFSSQVLC